MMVVMLLVMMMMMMMMVPVVMVVVVVVMMLPYPGALLDYKCNMRNVHNTKYSCPAGLQM